MRRVRYKQAAEYIGVPVGTVRSLVSRNKIPHIRVSDRCVLLDLDQLDVWIAAKTVQP